MKSIFYFLSVMALCSCVKQNTRNSSPVEYGPYSQSPLPLGDGPGFSEELKYMYTTEAQGRKGAMVVAAIDQSGVSFFAVGDTGKAALGPPDSNTLFEIGSVTKVFTAFALAIAVDKGEAKLSDRYVDLISNANELGIQKTTQITLQHLLQHTSGLARLPSNLELSMASLDPYADYSAQDLIDFLKRPNPMRPPGEAYAYSNTGTGILGWVLAQHQGLDYATLLKERIFNPLQLDDTSVHLSEKRRLRKAQGYLPDGTVTRGWTFQSLAPAGSIISTPRDMASFASVFLGLSSSPLDSTVTLMLTGPTHLIKKGKPVSIGFGWHLYEKEGKQIFWHNGKTASSDAFIGIDVNNKRAVVLLSSLHNNVTNLGFGYFGID